MLSLIVIFLFPYSLINRYKFHAQFPNLKNLSSHQESDVLKKRLDIRHRLTSIRDIQAVYMPCVPQLLASDHCERPSSSQLPSQSRQSTTHQQNQYQHADILDCPEDQPLFLPSHISADSLASCSPDLADIEEHLRDGQLRDALDKLRVYLHIKSRLVSFKNRNVCHQKECTRSQRKLQTNEAKISTYAYKYRTAWRAKESLVGDGGWKNQWPQLLPGDIRTLHNVEEEGAAKDSTRAGSWKRQISWIWMGADKTGAKGENGTLPGMLDGSSHHFSIVKR